MLISISDLELYLQKAITDTDDEDKYNFLISSVQDLADKLTFRKLEQAEYTEVHDGNGSSELFLNQYPISNVSLVEYGFVWSGSTRSEILSTDYLVYNDQGYLSFGFNSFDDGKQVFSVTYTAGFTSDDPSASNVTPDDLKQILMNEIESQKNRTFTNSEFKKEKLGDYSYEKFDSVTDDEDTISSFAKKLNKYIRSDL